MIECAVHTIKMAEFPFEGKLQRVYNGWGISYVTELGINAEWRLTCVWKNDHEPDFLEFRRKTKTGDIVVSGTFTLKQGQTSLKQRKFKQLIEDGFDYAHVKLGPLDNNFGYAFYELYSISGTLKIPAVVKNKEKTKDVNFDSLLVISSDFERLIDPKATFFSDVNLKCGTVSFPVHKNILSVRSPVFSAMFTSEMKENLKNKVDISDISPNVLKTMLYYIYTGKTGNLSVQTAGELLFASDKYQLEDLKKVCSDYLKSCVTVENVLEILVLGYLHEEELKVFATDFICSNSVEFEELENKPEWKNLIEEIPTLVIHVLTHLVKSKDERLKRKK